MYNQRTGELVTTGPSDSTFVEVYDDIDVFDIRHSFGNESYPLQPWHVYNEDWLRQRSTPKVMDVPLLRNENDSEVTFIAAQVIADDPGLRDFQCYHGSIELHDCKVDGVKHESLGQV